MFEEFSVFLVPAGVRGWREGALHLERDQSSPGSSFLCPSRGPLQFPGLGVQRVLRRLVVLAKQTEVSARSCPSEKTGEQITEPDAGTESWEKTEAAWVPAAQGSPSKQG